MLLFSAAPNVSLRMFKICDGKLNAMTITR